MTRTRRIDILQSLAAAIDGISADDGYKNTLKGSVFLGRSDIGQSDSVPCITITENYDQGTPLSGNAPFGTAQREIAMEIVIQGYAQDDIENPTVPAYYLVDDLKDRLIIERLRLDDSGDYAPFDLSNIIRFEIGQEVIRPPDGVNWEKTFFFLPVSVNFIETLGIPAVNGV